MERIGWYYSPTVVSWCCSAPAITHLLCLYLAEVWPPSLAVCPDASGARLNTEPMWESPRGTRRRMPGHGGALRSTGVAAVHRPLSRWPAGSLLNKNRGATRKRVGVP